MENLPKPDWFHRHEQDDNRRFDDIQGILKEILDSQNEFHAKATPVFEWFEHMTWGKKTRINMLKMTGLITSVILGILAVLASVWAGIKFLILNAK